MTVTHPRAALLAAAIAIAWQGPAFAQRGDFGRGDARRPEVRGVVKSVDVGGKSITIAVGGPRDATATDKVFAVAPDVEVALGGNSFGRGAVLQESKLADLPPGVAVSLALSADEKTVQSILAEEPTLRGVIQKVDAVAKTITVETNPGGRGQPADAKTYSIADDAEIAVDDGRGRRFSIREAQLTDVAAGSLVTVWLSLDRQKVRGALAEGPTWFGTVKMFDPNTRSLTLSIRPPRGDDAGEERTLIVAPEAGIVLDDGKGRRLSLKTGKPADVPVGAAAMARLSPDQSRVMQLRVEGPTVMGLFKSADAEKGTITISIPKGRDTPEERTIAVAKDARVFSEGAEVPLGSLKSAGDGPLVQLKLTLDQSKAQIVNARQPQGR